MFSDDQNEKIVSLLEALEAAAAENDLEGVTAAIDGLREAGFNPLYLDGAAGLVDSNDFEGLVAWGEARREELGPSENPFAGGFDFDVDDAFLNLEDTGFREPDVVDGVSGLLNILDADKPIEVASEEELSTPSEAFDQPSSPAKQKPGRPHVLSGRFNVVTPMALEADRKSLADQLDEVAAGTDRDEPQDPARQTKPNIDHDRITSHGISASDHEDAQRSDAIDESDASAPDDDEVEIVEVFEPEADDESSAASEPEVEPEESVEEEDEAPEPEPVKMEASKGFDFDFGSEFEESEAVQSEPTADGIDYDPSEHEKALAEDADRSLTPLRQLPAQGGDLFGDLAEALAADSSVASAPQYRGEPMRAQAAETNPFSVDAPTGTSQLPLAAESHAAQSHVQTNMNAILLEAYRLRSVGELEAALDIAKKVISRGSNDDALELRDDIERQLEERHLDKLGTLDLTPKLALAMSELSTLDLDHRAGYIISQVDGMLTFEDLIELSGMSRLETLEVLCELKEHGVIDA